MRPGEGDNDNRQQQRRNRQQRIENMIQHGRTQTVRCSGDHAEKQPAQRCGERNDKRAAHGGGCAAEQSAQDVASQIVSTEEEGDFAIA